MIDRNHRLRSAATHVQWRLRRSLPRLLGLFIALANVVSLAEPPLAAAGTKCEGFGCVAVELRYDGGRTMRYSVRAYNFRPGTIVADGVIYDSTNSVYLDIPPKTCRRSTECLLSGPFRYPPRCDGEVFELDGTGHRREDPQTDVVEEADLETAPLGPATVHAAELCQR